MHLMFRRVFLAAALVALAVPARAQQTPLSIDAIFGRREFGGAPLPRVHWMKDGRSYMDVRPNPQGGTDNVRVDLPTGQVTVLMNAAELMDEAGNRIDVEGLTAKFLLIHGTGDDNVHPQNSYLLANQLQAAGKPFQMMLYPNRTHSISGGNTQVHLFNMMTQFVKDNL